MIGIDIGSKSIKLVELEKAKSGWNLLGSGIASYNGESPEKIEDETQLNTLAQTIKRLHKDTGVTGRDVGISLPESVVFTRTVKFPLLTDQEIASAIRWEAEQYIPIPVSEAVVKYKIIERNEKSSVPGVSVLLVAAPTAVAEKYIKVFQMASLNVTFVETELIALTRSLAPLEGTAILLDFGAKSTDIAITRSGNLIFSRSVPIAGDALTRAVVQGLGVELQMAEEYKKTYGFSASQQEGKIKLAMEPILGQITDEIKKAIHFYQTEDNGDTPSSVIIAGGSAGVPEIIPIFSQKLEMEIVLGNPFKNVTQSADTQKKMADFAHLYSIAAGVAMRTE